MPADLTGLTPYVDYSKKLMDEAFPGGKAGFDDKALQDEINKRLWGTGTTPGIYSQFARRGLSEIQPETQYATSRVVKESMEDLLNQYQARQIAALNTGRTAVLTEPTFRASVESPVSGYYEGQPTLARTEAENRQRSLEAYLANENRKFELEKWKALAGGVGSLAERTGLLDWLFGSRSGTGTGGLVGAATQGVVGTALSSMGKAVKDFIMGGGNPADVAGFFSPAEWSNIVRELYSSGGILPGTAATTTDLFAGLGLPSVPASDISDLLAGGFYPFPSALAPAAGAGAGAGAAGSGFLASGGVGPAASSIEADLIGMLGPELAAKLGFTAPTTGTGAGILGASAPAWASSLPFLSFALPAMMPLLNPDKSGAIEDADALAAQADIYAHPEIAEEMISNPWRRPRAYRSAMENHRDANIRNRFMAALGGTSIDYQPIGQREQDARVQEAIEAHTLATGVTLTPEQYAWMNVPDTGR